MSSRLPPTPPPSQWLWLIRILTLVLVIAAVVAAFYFRDHIQALRPYGYAGVFAISLIGNATLILPVPGLAVTSIMGAVLNPILVGIVAGLGQAIGEMTGYMAGYSLVGAGSSQTFLDNNPRYHKLAAWMRRYGAWTIFVLAAIPNPAFDVAGLVAGALRVPVWKFLLMVAMGGAIKNTAFAYLGRVGSEVFTHW